MSSTAEIEHPAARATIAWSNIREGLEVHHDGDLPARSGLGSSSSFTVGMLNALGALVGQHRSKNRLAKLALHLEQDVMGEPVGSQDQIAAAFGGFNRIDFHTDGSFAVEPVVISQERRDQLLQNLMLFFSGTTRFSATIAQKKIENLTRKHRELSVMGQMVPEALSILSSPDQSLLDFGRLLHESWQLKRTLADGVSSDMIDQAYDAARSAGAIGGKVLGAGGGGFLLFFVEVDKRQRVEEALSKLIHVPFGFDRFGSVIIYSEK